jgi:acyl-CoA thioesterase FadM
MNLWFRLIWYLLAVKFRPPIVPTDGFSELRLRVWPTDLDLSLHLNNGRYLTIMDLGRFDFMVRTGLWRPLLRHRWTPIASTIMIRFRREMRAFQRFRLETRIVGWAEASVVMEQLFIFEDGPHDGQVAARAMFKGGLYDRKARTFVPILRLMAEIGVEPQPRPSLPEVEAFIQADNALRERKN